MNYSKFYFPKGCSLCGGDISLNVTNKVYVCGNCGAYTTYHKKTTEFSLEYEPLGYLAPNSVNMLRRDLKQSLAFFWRFRVDLKEGDGYNNTFPINKIYPDYLVKHIIDGEYEYGKSLCTTDDVMLIVNINNGSTSYVTVGDVEHVQNREKVNVWLSVELGLNPAEFKIGMLTEDQLKRAISICYEKTNFIKSISV